MTKTIDAIGYWRRNFLHSSEFQTFKLRIEDTMNKDADSNSAAIQNIFGKIQCCNRKRAKVIGEEAKQQQIDLTNGLHSEGYIFLQRVTINFKKHIFKYYLNILIIINIINYERHLLLALWMVKPPQICPLFQQIRLILRAVLVRCLYSCTHSV